MDQFSFEEGLLLGIRTSLVVVERDKLGRYAKGKLDELLSDTERLVGRRRNGGIDVGRQMVAADIFLPLPLAHAADFGLPPSAHEDERVAASRMRFNPQEIAALRSQRKVASESARDVVRSQGVKLHPRLAIAAAARERGDAKQAPSEGPQSGAESASPDPHTDNHP